MHRRTPTDPFFFRPVISLEFERKALNDRNEELRSDLATTRAELDSTRRELDGERRANQHRVEDLERRITRTTDDLVRESELKAERARKEQEEALDAARRRFDAELEDERRRHANDMQDLRSKFGSEHQDTMDTLEKRERDIRDLRSQLDGVRGDLERENQLKATLQTNIAELAAANVTLEAKMNSLRSQIDFLKSDSKAQSDSFADMEDRLQQALRDTDEARLKLIKEETERRILFNKYQELKGNIRVMCRVRPILDPSEGDAAKYLFPDEKTSAEITVVGPEERTVSGHVSRKNLPFDFDRVFTPAIRNEEVFGEISQLVQSALDGYNVCIFCYGQTGSGKTYTMSSADGMIPRATKMIYDTIQKLEEKSWTYTMEGSFIEVYNEELNDLLVPHGAERKRLDIRHDDARKQTTVVNCRSVGLDSPDKVEQMLAQAQNNRSVAATMANSRSSRSHSVFILKLVGENAATRERCEGTLNLVDLAGSERLKHSQVEGDRMKETQSINKSLSCLGDVIEALGKGSGHIPYRNSKLTHLLQYSLGGNSKTLMFVMVSPLEQHLRETITSLRFATKVSLFVVGGTTGDVYMCANDG
jgi:kinesin family protein C1